MNREGELPLGVKIIHRWVYLVFKFTLVYIFQVEQLSMHKNGGLPFLICHLKGESK